MNSPTHSSKLSSLEKQIQRFSHKIRSLEIISNRFSWIRLGVFLAGILTSYAVIKGVMREASETLLIILILLFAVLVSMHRRIERGIRRHEIWRQIKQTHAARMRLNWRKIPRKPLDSEEKSDPCEQDLNLTGECSLHQLMDTTLTFTGRKLLRDWLTQPPRDLHSLRLRQSLVKELQPLSNFRDRLVLTGEMAQQKPDQPWRGEQLLDWLDRHTGQEASTRTLITLSALSLTWLVLFFLRTAMDIPPIWTFVFVLYLGFYWLKIRQYGHLFSEASLIETNLQTGRPLLIFLETYPYAKNSHLAKFCEPFHRNGQQPSRFLNRIEWIAGAAACSQRNPLLAIVLNLLLPWDALFSFWLVQYKKRIKDLLRLWLQRLYELDALGSLATFADLNPDSVFPEFRLEDNANQPLLNARSLGHPLLPADSRIRNDFTIRHVGDIAIITGSNMSGKSTFLRTLGINLCLAYAGAPVMASEFSTVLFRVFTCIQVNDSLNNGLSSFYAEVRRLKSLLDELGESHSMPLFFLIDEIFRGTNNRERRIGSNAYIRALAKRNGVGVISTHDLELAQLADEYSSIRNYHFREEFQDGRMRFEYRLCDGPCPTTNALQIMQMEGLPVHPV